MKLPKHRKWVIPFTLCFALASMPLTSCAQGAGEQPISTGTATYAAALSAGTGSQLPIDTASTPTLTLSSGQMDALVDTKFPRVIEYTMQKGNIKGKKMSGQSKKLDTLRINGVNVKPTVKSFRSSDGKKIVYNMTAKDDASHIDADITAEISVENNVLTFQITKIDSKLDRKKYPFKSIEIPNHSLVSVQSSQADANLKGARFGTDTTTRGDEFYPATSAQSANGRGYFYAFVSNKELSAGLSSNSQVGTAGGGSDNYRVVATVESQSGATSVGLQSALWYYDRPVSDSYNNTYAVSAIPDGKRVVGPGKNEMPFCAKVVITGDENGDQYINWQDGAIAARDAIIHIPYKGEEVRDIIGTRVVMNFGSQAQNPFLTTLDNIKRVYLNTDGLGQGVLLKGYQSEGHDSGHPDYDNIGSRMGGVSDFNTLLTEGKKLNAYFGLHINAGEFYPESKAFKTEAMLRDTSGNLAYGWQWIDQAVTLNSLRDMATGERASRLQNLKNIVGNRVDFIYVDIWGNQRSSSEDAWQTRKLSDEITGNGWRIGQEWAYANEWDATYLHWVSDYANGTGADKAMYNSEVLRFLFNGYKDCFLPDYPHYGGVANAPLLGGSPMQGFEGWQKEATYARTIENIFNQVLPSKFLQHYDVVKWQNAEQPVALPYNEKAWTFTNQTKNWLPEAQITLQDSERKNTVVVTRGTDSKADKSFSYSTEAQQLNYRSRVITLNGVTILQGAPKPGETDTKLPGTMSYLLPWFWDASTGERVSADREKLYHYNNQGGETTWQLVSSWKGLKEVKVYELTDNGRVNETTVPVKNGKITLNAKANTPYVVTRGSSASPTVSWSTGTHLKDVSFNAANLSDNWTVSGSAKRYQTGYQIPMLKMSGQASVKQTITGLTAGKQYAVYVGVDNRSNAKASITVTDSSGKVLGSNYTNRSIAQNYVGAYVHNMKHPPEGQTSYFQNMYVFFTAPSSGTATLTLSRDAGSGNTYFDDVRVVENNASNFTYDGNGNVTKFTQDFESVVQGEYPFVVAGIEGPIDNRQHLSEKHAPYTQSGWDAKKLDDVIGGNWSLKVYDMAGKNKLVYQTIPQNFRFEPGVTYEVSFDYEMGVADGYAIAIGYGEVSGTPHKLIPLSAAMGGKPGHAKFTITGDQSGQTWFGIYGYAKMNENAPKNSDYDNFILDNLTIVRK